MQPGTRVRLKVDPGRVGVITGKTRERGDRIYYQVVFPDDTTFELESILEIVIQQSEDPIDLLQTGRIGRVRDLRGHLTYIRLNGRLANLIYSMDTTNTDFYPFQFKPVLNFIDSPSGGILIADEVGLGKTIEAGLIWTELRSRFESRRLMVLCPAMLQPKWQYELLDKFGIDAQIINAKDTLRHLKDYRSGNRLDFACIGSMQGLRPRRGWDKDDSPYNASRLARFLKENEYEEPLIDLLIIDEAHYLRNPESMTSKLGFLLAAVSDFVVLLSATPIHLRSLDLYQLLNMIDENTFYQPIVFDEILKANEPLINARELVLRYNPKKEHPDIALTTLKKLLQNSLDHPYLNENRQLKELILNLPETDEFNNLDKRAELGDRLERINLLSHVVNRTRKRDVKEFRVIREVYPEIIPMTEVEEEFYYRVTKLVRDYARRNIGNEGFLTVMPQREMSSSMPAALESWLNRSTPDLDQIYEDFGLDHERNEEIGPLTRMLIDNATELGDLKLLYDNDSKYIRLKEVITNHLRKHPKDKIVLFAYFKSTLKYLERRLSLDGVKCKTLMGGSGYNKYDIINKFSETGGPNVLLSSEVASEGVDLQFSKVLINYDLPWNPMKIEQRIGRIDRLGQESKNISIWNLFYENTIDERIFHRLYERLDIFKRSLGDLEAIIGEQIQHLTWELLSKQLTKEQEEQMIAQTEQAIANRRLQEENLENEASNLIAHGDYILHQVQAAKELQRTISSTDLWVFVRDFFDKTYEGSEFVQINTDELLFDVRLSDKAKYDLELYIQKYKLYGQTRLTSISVNRMKCRFLNKSMRNINPNLEIISQFHPLIRFVSDKIKQSGEKYYSPVGAQIKHIQIPNIKKDIYVFTIQLWSLEGIRDIERLYFAVKSYQDNQITLKSELAEKLIVTASLEGNDWLTVKQETDLNKAIEIVNNCLVEADDKYKEFVQKIQNENNDRADIQEKSLKAHRDKQLEMLDNIKMGHKAAGRLSLVKATEGKINKLRSRVKRQLIRIDEQRKLRYHRTDVCIGLIKVY